MHLLCKCRPSESESRRNFSGHYGDIACKKIHRNDNLGNHNSHKFTYFKNGSHLGNHFESERWVTFSHCHRDTACLKPDWKYYLSWHPQLPHLESERLVSRRVSSCNYGVQKARSKSVDLRQEFQDTHAHTQTEVSNAPHATPIWGPSTVGM